jgi:hypothetical protein
MLFILFWILFAIFPIILSAFSALKNNTSMFDESNNSGTYLWFLFATIPIGFFGLIVNWIVRSI